MIKLSNANVTAYVNEKSHIIGQIFVDDVSELPTADGIDGYELIQGSISYVIKSAELYVMGGDGKWYSSQDGTIAENTVNSITESDSIITENSE